MDKHSFPETDSDVEEIDLLELFSLLLSKWPILLIGLLIGAVLAGALTTLQTPIYQSSATLYVLNKTTTITSMADLQIGEALSKDFVVIATSKPVLDMAIEQVNEANGTALTRVDVQKMVTVTNNAGTRLLTIAAQHPDPVIARDVAAAVAEATAIRMADIMKTDPPTTVEWAEISPKPMDNGLKRNVMVGALVGFLITAAAYGIPLLLDDAIRSVEDVERHLGTTVIGIIPTDKRVTKQKNLYRPPSKKHKKRKERYAGAKNEGA